MTDASHHVEVERKYSVEWGTPLPDLGTLDAVDRVTTRDPVELTAVYFDTRALDLSRAQVTVRRRTGGADEGWHLKEPGGPDRKNETRLPLGRAVHTVPKDLRSLVQGPTHGRRLVAVAEIRTRRVEHHLLGPDGETLAVVCDDDVHALRLLTPTQAQQWREWEVELVGGSPELVDAVQAAVVDAGAVATGVSSKLARALVLQGPSDRPRPSGDELDDRSPAVDVLVAYLAEQLAVLRENDTGLRGDSVHRLRIAARRLRSVLRTYRPALEDGAVDALRDELRWLGRELAAARDTEVLRAHLAAVTADEPRLWRHAVRRRIRSILREEHRSGHDGAVTAVASGRFQHLVRGVAAVVQAPPTSECGRSPAVEVLPRLLRQELRRVRRAARTASAMSPGPERDVALHEVRKKAKRARYAAESATPVLGPRAAKLAKRAKKVQRALGDHQDSVEARAWLERFAREVGDDPLAAFAAGRVHALEERRAATAVEEYDGALRRVPTRHLRRWLSR